VNELERIVARFTALAIIRRLADRTAEGAGGVNEVPDDVADAVNALDDNIDDLFALVASWGQQEQADRLWEAWQTVRLHVMGVGL